MVCGCERRRRHCECIAAESKCGAEIAKRQTREHRHCCAAHQSGRKYRVTKEGILRLTNYDAATRSLSFEG